MEIRINNVLETLTDAGDTGGGWGDDPGFGVTFASASNDTWYWDGKIPETIIQSALASSQELADTDDYLKRWTD